MKTKTRETLIIGVRNPMNCGVYNGYIECRINNKMIWREESKILRGTEHDAFKDATRMIEDYKLTNKI